MTGSPVPVPILIVEDIAAMRQLLSHVLAGLPGFVVSGTAENGWEARLEISRRRPEVILLDEILPGESAADLLGEFVSQGISVILLTGVSKPSHEILPGALGRVLKPGWNSIQEDRLRLDREIRAFLAQRPKV